MLTAADVGTRLKGGVHHMCYKTQGSTAKARQRGTMPELCRCQVHFSLHELSSITMYMCCTGSGPARGVSGNGEENLGSLSHQSPSQDVPQHAVSVDRSVACVGDNMAELSAWLSREFMMRVLVRGTSCLSELKRYKH